MIKIADIDVDDGVLAEYIEKVRHMIEKGKEMPIGVSLGYMDSEREELHDKILDVHNQSRGSAFDIALRKHVEDMGGLLMPSRYAHSIKNPHIKHWVTTYGGSEPREPVYICNGSSSTTPEKIAKRIEDVTCTNCIRLLKKEGAY